MCRSTPAPRDSGGTAPRCAPRRLGDRAGDDEQPTMTDLYAFFQKWCDGPLGLSAEDQEWVFAKTAEEFYRI